ncbi:MAG: DUF1080 domain-containing protein [Kiritimatiellia bacterium]
MENSFKSLLAAGLVSVGVVGFASCAGGVCTCAPTANACSCKAPCACADCTCKGAEGRWAIQKPGAFWLGVFKDGAGKASASLLWGGGSPSPQFDVKVDGVSATMKQRVKGDKDPAKARIRITTLTASGATADVVFTMTDGTGKVIGQPEKAKAKRIPALPPAPDRAKAVYGQPVDLLANGLDGWVPMSGNYFGWSVKDGVLSNRIKRTADGKRDGASANLKTKRADFFDFKIAYDVRVPAGCNSGVYLRGIYELQVLDSYGRPVDCHNMAAFYGRITPRVAAEKPAGEWQHVEALLYKRHITVVLNGVTIIDNEPILGCTGGAITSDEFVKGPIYLQGDHSDADFRNMVLTPVLQ